MTHTLRGCDKSHLGAPMLRKLRGRRDNWWPGWDWETSDMVSHHLSPQQTPVDPRAIDYMHQIRWLQRDKVVWRKEELLHPSFVFFLEEILTFHLLSISVILFVLTDRNFSCPQRLEIVKEMLFKDYWSHKALLCPLQLLLVWKQKADNLLSHNCTGIIYHYTH